MCVTLIAVAMHTKVMYCFSCYLALYLEKYLQYNIDITTEQSFRYMEFIHAKIWISKSASLCRVFANRVTIMSNCIQGTVEVAIIYVFTIGSQSMITVS